MGTTRTSLETLQTKLIERHGVSCMLQHPDVIEKNRYKFCTDEAIQKKANNKKVRQIRHNINRKHIRNTNRTILAEQLSIDESDITSTLHKNTMQEKGLFYNIEGKTLKEHWQELFVSQISYSHLCKIYKNQMPTSLATLQELIKNSCKMSDIELALSDNPNVTRYDKYPCKYANFRPDFQVNDKLYVNVDGLYWHSDNVLDAKYHISIREKAENIGVNILQFRADEIQYKRHIVDSMIAVKAGLAVRKYARKLKIEEIPTVEAKLFLNNNHLMGFCGSTQYIALKENDNIQALLAVLITGASCKVTRFCGALNTTVIGGYSKLLAYVKNKFNIDEIITFVDLRYGTTSSLKNMGFIHAGTTLGWKWTDYDKTFNRLKCRANMDKRKLSESEYAAEYKWTKIYDAGQAKMIWKKYG